jgi:hypothetical protein
MTDDGVFPRIPLTVDPEMPPGVFEMRSGDNRLRALLAGTAEEMLWQRFRDDPEFAEEITSLAESRDYVTCPGQAAKPEKCEVCGTLVTVVPEVPGSDPRDSKPEPALWDPGQWRKHTLRRCNAMRKEA